MNPERALVAHRVAFGCLVALLAVCVLWEWQITPIRPNGSWLILKAVPLLFPIFSIATNAARRCYTYQWSTLFIWFYFTEGVVRAWSDLEPVSRALAATEVLLCVGFFCAAVVFVRATPRGR